MTLTEIDQALDDWQARIAVASENLLALEDLPVVQRLRQEMGCKPPGLTGLTAAKSGPALALLPQMFQDISLLTDVLDRARNLRRPLNAFWRSERTLDEIQALLEGPSVALPAVQTPFLQRGLLSVSEQTQTITPGALLTGMSQTFEQVKATLLEIDAAWTRGETAVQAVRDKAAVLEQMAAALGEADAADMVEIRAHLERWAGQIASDPLGSRPDKVWNDDAALRRTRKRLEAIAASRDQAMSQRDAAQTLLAEWEAMRRQTETACARCLTLFSEAPPRGPDRLPEMRRWLTTLETACAARRWTAADVGFGHWLEAARNGLEEEKGVARDCAAWLESLEELPGRFAALRAKADARALGAHPALIRAAGEAETILRQKPFPRARAEASVAAYAEALNALLKARA